jgi:hypothetical protein
MRWPHLEEQNSDKGLKARRSKEVAKVGKEGGRVGRGAVPQLAGDAPIANAIQPAIPGNKQ